MLPWRRFPFFVYVIAVSGAAMFVPTFYGASVGDFASARLFLYCGVLILFSAVLIGLSLANRHVRGHARSHLLAIVATFVVLPAILCIPIVVRLPALSFLGGYFEMVSSLTTTGATVFSNPNVIPETIHLWRGMIGWMGGYLIVLAALAIMAPLDIGGFEIRSAIHGAQAGGANSGQRLLQGGDRLLRTARQLTPIYGGLTALLFLMLLFAGQDGFSAALTAMAVISTSGITHMSGPISGDSGMLVEMVIAVFLICAASGFVFDASRRRNPREVRRDVELRMLLSILMIVPGFLFIRHFIGAIEVEALGGFSQAFEAAWGLMFTVLSFLTTMGGQSAFWDTAQAWSGLETPGLLFMALAAMGGGVASTAGGIKLLRVYALYKHGIREMERLTLPNSVAGAGQAQRRIRREGAFIAWVFLMLFLLSIAVSMLALALTGIDMVTAMQLAVVSLSNTGPGVTLIMETPVLFGSLSSEAQLILCATMILGRLEALALIALFDPTFWRR
ncbi:trk system potassium uptake protein TrkH [Rubricella aquisinus]|uniref:Trk system potassium uptake protein TrkH n=1 Tax=Rubricella aquisinus TaxID=2028108 RepID=A0A840WMA4_9RHOB|nr:potassium transporter TrkG [Rubricella aquisinus]MBB5514792.1 trk system potassium uptake protein TrkH [Rubricella aquisinus]